MNGTKLLGIKTKLRKLLKWVLKEDNSEVSSRPLLLSAYLELLWLLFGTVYN
ncbi:hypothetical protein D3C85_1896230 [compost metagenome]